MTKVIDDLDKEILRGLPLKAGPLASISGIFRSFQNRISYSSFYDRIRDLESKGLIKTNKQRHCVVLEVTGEGLMEAQVPKEA